MMQKSYYDQDADFFRTTNLKHCFEEQVRNNSSSICVIDQGNKYTYQDVNILANQLANYLKHHNLMHGEYVLILSSNNIKFLIAALAAIKIGAVYAPVSISTPYKRIQNIIHQINPKFIIDTDDQFNKNRFRNISPSRIINSYMLDHTIKNYSCENLDSKIVSTDELYIIFTSGSSGYPKGIVNSHRSTLNRVYWAAEVFPIQKNDVGYQKTSINFVDHIAELYTPLLLGMPLVFPDNKDILINNDPINIIDDIQVYQITRIVLTPSYLKTLVEYSGFNAIKLKSLKYIFISGEILTFELVRKVYNKLPKVVLVNIYGSSEVSADASFFIIPRNKKIQNSYVKDLFLKSEKYIQDYCHLHMRNIITTPNTSIQALSLDYLKINKISNIHNYDTYLKKIVNEILPYAVNVSSPRFIGHMTSGLPNYNLELSKLITALNQNLVKIETSKVFTLLERQVLGLLHKFFYHKNSKFYKLNIQDSNSVLGIITSNGSISNVTALWIARNSSFPKDNKFAGIDKCGLHDALKYYNYSNAVILTSPLAHYSFSKAASLIGIGKNNVLHLPCKANYEIDFNALERMIVKLHENRVKIIAIIGICGATETGSIDDFLKLYRVSKKYNIHFHVDAAFGGPLIFLKEMKHLTEGINKADTITICGHKQLYLPLGISITLLQNPKIASNIYTTANYQAMHGSYDTGRYSIEGSRSAISLLLHAGLSIIGSKGYSDIVRIGINNGNYLRDILKYSKSFELLIESQINIVNYRYIPRKYRNLEPNEINNNFIDKCNNLLQEKQFELGRTFVSKTTIWSSTYCTHIVSLRVVFCNPLTTFEDINYVLQDQIEIAEEFIEKNTSALIKENFLLKPSTVPIGKPISNTSIYILDEQQNQVIQGQQGEIYISGACVSNGYFKDKTLTSAKYIRNPFHNIRNINDSILYKTGDIGRFLPDGNIEYLYRQDTQIKINGQRVNLLEVESAINHFRYIKRSIVLCNDELSKSLDSATRYLLAFIIWKKNAKNTSLQDLINQLSTVLLDYMIPKKFIAVHDFPLNANGKIDKAKLLELHNKDNDDAINKFNAIEKIISNIWQKCLGVHRVRDINDNFFSIGGNSILAMRLANAISDYFTIKVQVKFIYEYPTIYSQAQHIKNNKKNLNISHVRYQYTHSTQSILSYNQNILWKIYKQEKCTKIYNMTISHKLKREVSINDINICMHYLLKKHRILRAHFKEEKEEQVYQKIIPYSPDIMPKSIYEANDINELDQLIHQHSSFNFYPHNSIPIRVFYYKLLSDQSFYINIVIDHIIFDEWSKNILCNELNTIYIYFKINGILPQLELLNTIDYLHFASWQRKLDIYTEYKNQLSFWKKKLQTLHYFTIKQQNVATSKWLSCSINTNKQLLTKLKNFSNQIGVSLYSTILTGFFLLLHSITKSKDITIGITLANRNDMLHENILGYFAHCLPIRIKINTHDFIKIFVSQVMREVVLLQINQDIPLELICKKFQLYSENSHPIFSTTFNFLDLEGQKINKNHIFEHEYISQSNSYVQDTLSNPNNFENKKYIETIFNVSSMIRNDCLELRFTYDENLFQSDEVEKFAQQYIHILENINFSNTVQFIIPRSD